MLQIGLNICSIDTYNWFLFDDCIEQMQGSCETNIYNKNLLCVCDCKWNTRIGNMVSRSGSKRTFFTLSNISRLNRRCIFHKNANMRFCTLYVLPTNTKHHRWNHNYFQTIFMPPFKVTHCMLHFITSLELLFLLTPPSPPSYCSSMSCHQVV